MSLHLLRKIQNLSEISLFKFDFGGRQKPEICFWPGRLRWALLPNERHGNSLIDRGPNSNFPAERWTLYHWANTWMYIQRLSLNFMKVS